MAINTSNLVSYWKADRAGEFKDSKGTNHGTINGATYTVDGKIGGGYYFDGTNDDISMSGTIVDTSSPLTISVWANIPADGTNRSIVAQGGSVSTLAGYFEIRQTTSNTINAYFVTTDGEWALASSVLSSGWVHIIVTISTDLELFIDGVSQGTATKTASTNSSGTNNLYLGRLGYSAIRYFNGIIDEVGIWNTALSASEITELYNSGTGKTYDSTSNSFIEASSLVNGQVSYWKFDGDATDEIGQNDGTVTGATYTASGKINGAYDFDGVNDYIDISGIDGEITYPYTVGIWVKNPTWNTPDEVFFNMKIGTQRVTLGAINAWGAENALALMYGGTSHFTAPTPPADEWVHIVAVIIGSANTLHQIYVNGVSQPITNQGGSHGGEAGWRIGSGVNTNYFTGLIDEPAIWNRALTSTEITELYNSGSGKQYPYLVLGPIGYTNAVNGVITYTAINGILATAITSVNGVS